jgi:hypothetical protein
MHWWYTSGFLFLAGWLDQSWWPDGQYTAPTDEALAFDLVAVHTFGLNAVTTNSHHFIRCPSAHAYIP